ncbi:MAG: phosphoribosylamine--glycine ligase [Prevotellaceae bacterium]|jgi:phosphoribosylamine--glycine ligase|nr:phosphoribosylamine--glycine ligase [Prevotellaceae bacterium]
MNVLLLGSGGREHALAVKIAQSPYLTKLFIAPGNPGTAECGQNVRLDISDFDAVGNFVEENSIGMLVVGPEDPLVNGITDYFAGKHTAVIGPSRQGAALEGSKDFAKDFMLRHGIPTARHATFDKSRLQAGYDFLEKLAPPFVLKADGLAAGKGVIIVDSLPDAQDALKEMLDGKFGTASSKVVIEEFLQGIEISVFILTDGISYKILPEAKDYKRIGENDCGLNTGGMGAVSPVPFAGKTFMDKVVKNIIEPTVQGLRSDGICYKGFIFFGLMNCGGEPYLIEYNVRMGDPETEAVMPRLDADLLDLFNGVAEGTLDSKPCAIRHETAVTVVIVSGGYPEAYAKGLEIGGISSVKENKVYHAGTSVAGNKLVTSGGRVLAVTALADSLTSAMESVYRSVRKIKFEKSYYRRDIGKDLMQTDNFSTKS